MADIEVIYDPIKEMAAIVNLDTRQGWGPSMIGPQSGQLLEAFVEAVPFDITTMDPDIATEAFAAFLDTVADAVADTPDTPPTGTVGPSDGQDVAEARTAERDASEAAGSPPDPAPADTDEPPPPPPEVVLVTCPVCEGARTVDLGDGNGPTTCGFCGGLGKTAQAV